MAEFPRTDVTHLLAAYGAGDRSALDRLMPLVYEELRRLARQHLANERADHTFDTAALVHEAYLKLAGLDHTDWKNRAYFFAVASRAIRQILIDHARRRRSAKRGGGQRHLTLDESSMPAEMPVEELLSLNEALERLEQFDERKSRIVEYRFFGGLEVREVAEVLGLSPTTVKREWSLARAWLYHQTYGSAA